MRVQIVRRAKWFEEIGTSTRLDRRHDLEHEPRVGWRIVELPRGRRSRPYDEEDAARAAHAQRVVEWESDQVGDTMGDLL